MPDFIHSHRRSLTVAASSLAVLALAACGSSAAPAPGSTSPAPGAAAGTAAPVSVPASSECATAAAVAGAQTVATADYYLVMGVGEAEQMYTKSQVEADKPTSGEVMMGGTMMGASASGTSTSSSGMEDMPGMGGSTDAGTRHVEVKICNRQTGKLVTDKMPTMTMGAMNAAMASMPVAQMQGVGKGTADTHYGNNLPMTTGTEYTITCTVNGQTGTFTVKAPA